MNGLEQFYDDLNKSNIDCHSNDWIDSVLQTLAKKQSDEENKRLFELVELEKKAFSIQKSFDIILDKEKGTVNGLSWMISRTKKSDDGTEIPFYWPDVRNLVNEDFDYFEKRYNTCDNLYAKTEFGLLVYFGQRTPFSRHKAFKTQLCDEIFNLSKCYLEKSKNESEKNLYIFDFYTMLKTAFILAEKSKIYDRIDVLADFIFRTHQGWDIKNERTLRVLLDLSGLMIDHFRIFRMKCDLNFVLNKNLDAAKELEKYYLWGAIYCIDKNIELSQKMKISTIDIIKYKAELYHKLSIEAQGKGNVACVRFSEKSLRYYRQLDDNIKIEELEKLYREQRGSFRFGKFKQTFSKETSKKVFEGIGQTINECDPRSILDCFISSLWYENINVIKEHAREISEINVFMSLFNSTVHDKFGNAIDKSQNQEEKDEHHFWLIYGFYFQLGTQIMCDFFIEGYKAKKITKETVLSFLRTTWYNDSIQRKYHGEIVEIRPIDLIEPCINRLFTELDNCSENSMYQFDYVTLTDSIVLKIETIVRNICEKIGIATFKPRQKGADELVMEKLLDDLLVDIKHIDERPTGFEEEDRIFIKYVLTEKSGLNLRNQVAHGLLDIQDYTLSNIVVVFSIIIRLSKYMFNDTRE